MLARQPDRDLLRDAAVVEPAAAHDHGREHAGEAARRAHRVAHVALAEDDRPRRVSTSVASTRTGTRSPSKRGTGRNSSISRPEARARQQAAAPAAHPHPGCRRDACSTRLVEVGAARPGRGHQRAAATRRRSRPPAPAPASSASQHARVRRRVRAAAGEREVPGASRRAPAWISCRLTTSSVALAQGLDGLHGGRGGGQRGHAPARRAGSRSCGWRRRRRTTRRPAAC